MKPQIRSKRTTRSIFKPTNEFLNWIKLIESDFFSGLTPFSGVHGIRHNLTIELACGVPNARAPEAQCYKDLAEQLNNYGSFHSHPRILEAKNGTEFSFDFKS